MNDTDAFNEGFKMFSLILLEMHNCFYKKHSSLTHKEILTKEQTDESITCFKKAYNAGFKEAADKGYKKSEDIFNKECNAKFEDECKIIEASKAVSKAEKRYRESLKEADTAFDLVFLGGNTDDIVKAAKIKVESYIKARKDKMLVENKLGPAVYMKYFMVQQNDAFYKGYLDFVYYCADTLPKDTVSNESEATLYIIDIFTKMGDVYNGASTAGYKKAYAEGYTASPDIFIKKVRELHFSKFTIV
jgi:hypothetical protein